MSNKRNPWIQLCLLVGILSVFVWYILANPDEFKILANVKLYAIAIAALGHIGIIALNAYVNWRLLLPFDIKMSVKDSLYVSLISSMGNFFLPMQSGAGVRAVYLKKRYKFSYDNFALILTSNYVLVFLINAIVGLAALFLLRDIATVSQLTIIGGAFTILATTSLVIIANRGNSRLMEFISGILPSLRYKHALTKMQAGWVKLIKHKDLIRDLVVAAIIAILINIVIINAELSGLGLSTSFASLVLYSALGSIVLIVNITPASLGIRESILIFSAAALGLSIPEILAVAVIDRSLKLVILGSIWPIVHFTSFIRKRSTHVR